MYPAGNNVKLQDMFSVIPFMVDISCTFRDGDGTKASFVIYVFLIFDDFFLIRQCGSKNRGVFFRVSH